MKYLQQQPDIYIDSVYRFYLARLTYCKYIVQCFKSTSPMADYEAKVDILHRKCLVSSPEQCRRPQQALQRSPAPSRR